MLCNSYKYTWTVQSLDKRRKYYTLYIIHSSIQYNFIEQLHAGQDVSSWFVEEVNINVSYATIH